jgi:hypothetical protein
LQLTLIENGQVFAPAPLGRCSNLLADERIARVGTDDLVALERAGVEVDVVDAAGSLVIPGLIDPPEHLLGGSNEGDIALQSLEICRNDIPPTSLADTVRSDILFIDETIGASEIASSGEHATDPGPRELLDRSRFQVGLAWLHPPHVQRSEALPDEEALDVVAEGIGRWLRYYVEQDLLERKGAIAGERTPTWSCCGRPRSVWRQ